jgi:DNA invertase Pin-like site-specific DNA recombinase
VRILASSFLVARLYARISSDREGDNLAISRQLADCEALAKARGWEPVERYLDSDSSALRCKYK